MCEERFAMVRRYSVSLWFVHPYGPPDAVVSVEVPAIVGEVLDLPCDREIAIEAALVLLNRLYAAMAQVEVYAASGRVEEYRYFPFFVRHGLVDGSEA